MKTATLLFAAALALSAPVARAEEGGSTRVSPADLEEKFYQAFYAENGLRDFAKAAEAYAEVHLAARSVGRKDLAVKALLGRARCTRTMGKPDETKAALAGVLEMDPENAEAKAAAAADEATTPDETLRSRISHLIINGLTSYDGDRATSARELRLLGDRCLPVLAESLKEQDLGTVEAAATYLASLDQPQARAILIAAMRDPQVLFRTAIARTVCRPTADGSRADMDKGKPFSVVEIPVLAEAANSPEADVRREAANRLFQDGDRLDEAGRGLLARLASDPDRSVRAFLWSNFSFSSEVLRALTPALRQALASEDAAERARAAGWANNDPEVLEALEPLLRERLRDPDATVRANAFGSLRTRLSEEELGVMLVGPDAALAAGAATLLKGMSSWSPATGEAVLTAVRKALRGEVPANFTGEFFDLIHTRNAGALEGRQLVYLFRASGAPETRVPSDHLNALRSSILRILREPLHPARPSDREPTAALIADGVEQCLDSGAVLHVWVRYWDEQRFAAPRAWLRATLSADARARRAAYRALLRAARDENYEIPGSSLPNLANDLSSEDPEMRAVALELAEKAPSPELEKGLRALLVGMKGEERQRLLRVLVASAGRGAEDAVRAEFTAPGGQSWTALMLLMAQLRTGTRADLDAWVERRGDPGAVFDIAGLDRPEDRELLRRFALDLPVEKYTSWFVNLASGDLEGKDRLDLLRRALGDRRPDVLGTAARRIGELRILELWPDLLALLENGEAGVRKAAEEALTALKGYAEMKTTLARFGKDEATAALRTAEAMLDSDDPVKRKGAVLALAALGDRSAIPAMLRALDDKDPGVREAALAALERLGGTPTPK